MFAAKKISAMLSILVLSAAIFTGCSSKPDSVNPAENVLTDTGTIILRVNPEISIKYNKDGFVTSLEGLNDDGKAILDDYDDYIGKNAREVVKDLVEDINEAGYFVSGVDGSTRNVTIQTEPGSVLPQSDYMDVLAGDVREAVESMNLGSQVVKIGLDDYDDINDDNRSQLSANSSSQSAPNTATGANPAYIAQAKAKEIALAHAGLKESDVTFTEASRDNDDGHMEYELEFHKGNIEYTYEIDAKTGKIISFNHEVENDNLNNDLDDKYSSTYDDDRYDDDRIVNGSYYDDDDRIVSGSYNHNDDDYDDDRDDDYDDRYDDYDDDDDDRRLRRYDDDDDRDDDEDDD